MTQMLVVPVCREPIGTRIRRVRTDKNIEARDIAQKVQMSYAQFLRIERNEVTDPYFWTIVEIAKVLECSIDYLVYGVKS